MVESWVRRDSSSKRQDMADPNKGKGSICWIIVVTQHQNLHHRGRKRAEGPTFSPKQVSQDLEVDHSKISILCNMTRHPKNWTSEAHQIDFQDIQP